ncbi:isoprenylcysteine carboxylmethyltransferase family protein [Prescottella sp. R16]|uniref:methyltransferase family protein n=1 Tax=Prescottella sp. R16 TaxID=3064529 RepID=UPI00272EBF94|nr:isoprenylcysteine carboxylmethyltransferase family protein [Prescottella sp. R16]
MADERVLPLFASEPAAAALLAAALAALLFSEFRIGRTHPDGEHPDDAWTGPVLGVGLTAVYLGGPAVSVLVPATVLTTGAWWYFAGGLVIAVAGQAIRLRAVHELGASFTFRVQTVPGQNVVDTGLYRFVRHPSYSGALLCALGFTIACTNWLAPLTVSVLGAAYLVRIPHEERVLLAGLGEPYRQYMCRTRRIIPFVL